MRHKILSLVQSMAVANSNRRISTFLIVGLFALFLLPVGLGSGTNTYVPIIGWGESIVNTYCLNTLQKTQDAYLVTQVLDGAIAIARSAEANVGVLGVGVTASPGEILSPVHDSIKTLSSFFSEVILLVMVEKQAMGMLSYLCFKILLPTGILCFLAHSLSGGQFPRAKKAGALLCKTAFIVWLLLPSAAFLCNFVEKQYINPKYTAHVVHLKKEVVRVFNLPPTVFVEGKETSLKTIAMHAMATFRFEKNQSNIGKFKEIVTKITNIALSPDDLISLLMLLFSLIAITAYVIPLLVLILFFGLFRIAVSSRA